MNKVNLIVVFLLTLIITSCNDNEETHTGDECIGENYPVSLNRYIKNLNHTSLFSGDTYYDYAYNDFNLLAEMDRTHDNHIDEHFFNYQCNNNLHEKDAKKYTYNEENQLVAFSGASISYMDYEISYNGNTITVIGTIDSMENTELTLEMNASNLITKVIRATNYSIFEYDVYGNLISAKDFDLNDELLKAYEITYDQNPNPFYGQLSSIYIERFIFHFSTSAFDGIDYFFRFNGFDFPYLKNNPVILKDVECTGCYNLLERVYTYDSENYPTKIEESHVGAPAIIYNIEY